MAIFEPVVSKPGYPLGPPSAISEQGITQQERMFQQETSGSPSGSSQPTQSFEQESEPEMNPPIGPSEIVAPNQGHLCPPKSPPEPTLKTDDHNLSPSHSNPPGNSEQEPTQVEEVNRGDPPIERAGRYPRRIGRRPNKFSDDFLGKLEEGNYSVSTLSKNQTEILLESIEHLKFNDSTEDSNETKQSQIEPKADMAAGNVNLGKRGVELVALKVYHWFDDYENLDVKETLSPSQVRELINQGKVAKNHSITELEIVWEDLVNGPYFGDGRDPEASPEDPIPK